MRAPTMRRQKTVEILDVRCVLQLSRVTRAANFIGWRFNAKSNEGHGLSGFTNTLELDRAFDRVAERFEEWIKEEKKEAAFDRVFDRYLELPEYDRGGVAAFVMGMMSQQMSYAQIKKFEARIDQMIEARTEFQKRQDDFNQVAKEAENS